MKIKEFIIKFSNLIPFSTELLLRVSGKRIIFPYYHSISDKPSIFIKNLYSEKSKLEFEEDLQFLLKYFKPINVGDLLSIKLNKSKESDNYFLLSFDDGLRSYYDTVVPILIKNGMTAVNFLNSKFINNKFMFYRYKVSILIEELISNNIEYYDEVLISKIVNVKKISKEQLINWLLECSYKDDYDLDRLSKIMNVSFEDYLKRLEPYMSDSLIAELVELGFEFGGHSIDHPFYGDLMEFEQLKQTSESTFNVFENFSQKHKLFSFPFSDDGVSECFFKRMRELDVYTFGSAGLKDENFEFHYQRIAMEYSKNYSAKKIIRGELFYYILKRLIGKEIIDRK